MVEPHTEMAMSGKGTPVKDTECDVCPEGQYSDTNNAAQCSPWTKCVELGQILYKEGNSTADSMCKKRCHISLAFAFVPLLAVITYVVTRFSICKQGKKEADVQKKDASVEILNKKNMHEIQSVKSLLNTCVK
ncbi:unnamed protein product [Ranitomeya imitator]|uniref:TNFR-Cys domain-containing protein n=1 Tax=Ranitomeya imitator TaxID=111125 RepID=A0ABN9LM31_9NEOB|nr:unnamed protein product [Ranitomeya imitator]